MRDYIILNGVNSNTITGLLISTLPPITKPKQRTTVEEIDGRDGDIVTKLGYSAYDKELEIGLYGDFDIDDVIAYFNSEGTVTFSNEPDKFYNYQIIDQIDYEKLIRFKKAKIKMHVQPFKYPLEETPVEITNQYVNNEAEEIDLDNTKEAPMKIDLKGNTSQEGTPTPDAPQDIHVVSGDNSINVVGKNLFTLKNISNISTLGVERTINNSELKLNGTSSGAGQVIGRQTTGIILPGGTYSVLVQKKSGNVTPNGKYTVFYFRKPDGTEITALNINNYSGNYSFKTTFVLSEETELYVEIYCTEAGYTLDNLELQFQIEKGSSESDFEQFIGNTYPINLGVENLLPNNGITETSNGITFTKNADNTITLNGTATADTYTNVWYNTTNNLINDTNQVYTMSIGLSNSNVGLAIFEYVNNSWVNKKYVYAKSTTYTPSGNQTGQIFRVIVKNGATLNNVIVKPMLEVGTKVNTYAPYGTTPIELCKIGNYQDTIYKENGKWYVKKEIGKVVLNGSETISNYGATALSGSYQATFEITTRATSTDKIVLSDYFARALLSDRTTKTNICYTYTDGLLRIATNLATTMADFKTWLSTHNTSIYYVLATPTTTEITDATLIAQLNALANASSYDTKTHITQNANDKPFILNATALQQGSGEATVNNEGNIYSKPTLDIEGSGTVGIYLDGNQIFSIDLSNSSECVIDTTQLEAYNPTTSELMNRQVTGDYSNFKLNAGENQVSTTGEITKVTISNYTRWL